MEGYGQCFSHSRLCSQYQPSHNLLMEDDYSLKKVANQSIISKTHTSIRGRLLRLQYIHNQSNTYKQLMSFPYKIVTLSIAGDHQCIFITKQKQRSFLQKETIENKPTQLNILKILMREHRPQIKIKHARQGHIINKSK